MAGQPLVGKLLGDHVVVVSRSDAGAARALRRSVAAGTLRASAAAAICGPRTVEREPVISFGSRSPSQAGFHRQQAEALEPGQVHLDRLQPSFWPVVMTLRICRLLPHERGLRTRFIPINTS